MLCHIHRERIIKPCMGKCSNCDRLVNTIFSQHGILCEHCSLSLELCEICKRDFTYNLDRVNAYRPNSIKKDLVFTTDNFYEYARFTNQRNVIYKNCSFRFDFELMSYIKFENCNFAGIKLYLSNNIIFSNCYCQSLHQPKIFSGKIDYFLYLEKNN